MKQKESSFGCFKVLEFTFQWIDVSIKALKHSLLTLLIYPEHTTAPVQVSDHCQTN